MTDISTSSPEVISEEVTVQNQNKCSGAMVCIVIGINFGRVMPLVVRMVCGDWCSSFQFVSESCSI